MIDYKQVAALALAKCAAYDPWFPKASVATVEAWAEAIEEYRLDLPDVLAGVKLAYRDNGSGFKPLPKDIVQAARSVRRERTERESDEERRAREDRRDRVADEAALRQITARTGQRAVGWGTGETESVNE